MYEDQEQAIRVLFLMATISSSVQAQDIWKVARFPKSSICRRLFTRTVLWLEFTASCLSSSSINGRAGSKDECHRHSFSCST